MQNFLTKTFPAFKYRNYQLYFYSQLVSLIGTWLQMVAQSWLVLELTNSAYWVGVITAIGFVPILLFALFGGVIVDRFQTKNLLIFTNVFAAILALILGSLAILNLLNLFILGVLAFLLGIVNALDMPARQAFTAELVEKEHLPSAIALNMGMFNSSRVIGPAIAGILIKHFGNGGAFILNGLSFIAPVIALTLMNVRSELPSEHPHPLKAIKEGLQYTFTHKLIGNLILLAGIISIFGWSFNTLMPVIAKQTFNQDAQGLSYMYTAAGIGALIGTILVAIFARKFKELNIIFWGSIGFALSLIGFTLTNDFLIANLMLILQGISMAFPFAMLMSSLQHHVDPKVRGRVMSIFTLAMLGMQPFGSYQIGYLAEKFGNNFAIQFGAVMVLLFAIYIRIALRKED